MDFVLKCFIAGIVGALLIWYYAKWLPKATMKGRFAKLGNMAGMQKEDIEKKIGRPKMSHYHGGYSRHTWQAGTYAVTLQFNEANVCTKLISEVEV